MGNQELYKSATAGKAGDVAKTLRSGLGPAPLLTADLYAELCIANRDKACYLS